MLRASACEATRPTLKLTRISFFSNHISGLIITTLRPNTQQFLRSLLQTLNMSSIVTAVFKVTIGLLVNKGRDKAAEKLKDGDVTDQQFRGLIVREIDDIKSKLDGLSRKDLLASISFFEEGIELLYEVFGKAKSRSEHSAATTQAACDKAFFSAKEMKKLEIADLDESAVEALSMAKERFKDSRRKATEAFKNEALATSDRILAMQYRVMATILETVDNPEHAIARCRVCLKELNSLSAVQKNFDVQLKKGIQAAMSLFGRDERRKIISSVCHVNRVIFDVTQALGKDISFWMWPVVDIGEGKIDPLRDRRVAKVLRELGMEHCCVTPWSFGQEGEEEHRLKKPRGIATNSSGQFIVGDNNEVKMFEITTGQFIQHFSLPNDDVETELYIWDVATDNKDNIYVLVECSKFSLSRYLTLERVPCKFKGKRPGNKFKKTYEIDFCVYEFSNTADMHLNFSVRGGDWVGLTVTNGKVLILRKFSVDVYDTDGLLVRSFGEGTLKEASDITVADDGRVMLVEWRDSCIHIFSGEGDYLNKFKLQGRHTHYDCPRIAFHILSEHVVIADEGKEEPGVVVEIFTKDGEFVRSTQIHEERIDCITGMTVTRDRRIAVLLYLIGKITERKICKVLVI